MRSVHSSLKGTLTVRQRELLMDVCSVLDDEQTLLMKSIIGGLSP